MQLGFGKSRISLVAMHGDGNGSYYPIEQNKSEVTRHIPQDARVFAFRAVLVASFGGLLTGFDLGVVTGALPQLRDEMGLNANEQELVVSLMVLGAFFGSICGGFICDSIGRWWTIILSCSIFIISGPILCLAKTVSQLYAGRLLVGVGISFGCIADISYLSEIAHKQYRGSMVSFYELMIAVGVLLSFIADFALQNIPGGWRKMFALGVAFAILQVLGMISMPESPKWLMSKGREAEAASVVRMSYGNDIMAREALNEIEEEIAEAGITNTSSIFHQWRHQLCLAMFLMALQQFAGNVCILSFFPEIIEHVDSVTFDTNQSSLHISKFGLTVVLGMLKAFFTALVIFKVDIIGRKNLLLVGSGIISISLFMISGGFAWGSVGGQDMSEYLVFLGACGVIGAYSISFGPISWLVSAELFPPGLRGRALGLSQLVNWLSSFAITSVFLNILDQFGGIVTFGMFATITLFGFVIMHYFLPETINRTPHEIAIELEEKIQFLFKKELYKISSQTDPESDEAKKF